MKVGIIGAGPRGILLTSQLFNQYKYHSDQTENCRLPCLTRMALVAASGERINQTN